MNTKRFNWPLWLALVLSFAGSLAFFFIFVWIPATRDFPWVNLLIFVIAAVFLVMGVRRGFASDRPHPTRSKVITSIVTMLSVAIIGLFLFAFFVMGRWLPASAGAPQVGRRAPDFTLSDTTGKQVSLAELRTAPIDGNAPKGVLLIFYRGYW